MKWVVSFSILRPFGPSRALISTQAPQGALPGTSFVVRAPTGALIAATFPPGIGPGYSIYVHAPGAWGAIATSAVSTDPPPPHYQAPVALVTSAGVGEPAPIPGSTAVVGWGA